MSNSIQRVVLVGASSLLGREIAEELHSGTLAAAAVVLLDSDTEPGKLEEIGGEAAVLQPVEVASFEGADVVIFATAVEAGRYWEDALRFGAAAVDATGSVRNVQVLSPRLGLGGSLSLESTGAIAAHPVTTMLAAVLAPLHDRGLVEKVYATVLQPVSENGAVALDEMHQQAVSLLSFAAVPTEQHDVQVAFNLLPRLGEEAKMDLAVSLRTVETQFRSLLPNLPAPAMQWVQASTFHGYAVSLFVTSAQDVDRVWVEEALAGPLLKVTDLGYVPSSNVSVAGEEQILVEVLGSEGRVLRLWLVADNLKLLAQTAVASAAELLRMRPSDVVQ